MGTGGVGGMRDTQISEGMENDGTSPFIGLDSFKFHIISMLHGIGHDLHHSASLHNNSRTMATIL